MAVSSSIDLSYTAAQIVTMARRKLGIQAQEEPLEAADLEEGIAELNLMLKGWQADGVYYWTLTEGTLTLVEGQASYTFQAAGSFTTVPFSIEQILITRSSVDMEMNEISREDYRRLPNKTTKGFPTQWYYDRQRATGTLYVWPTADATLGTLKFDYRRVLMDVDASTDNLDLPQEWYDAVVYGLADRLGENNGMADDRLTLKALKAYQTVKDFQAAESAGSIMVVPE